MLSTPAQEGFVGVPDYWSYATFSFNRSQTYPDHPEYWNVFPNDISVYDINGDGHLDVLVTYAYIPALDDPGIPIRVLLGDGQGGLIDSTTSLFPAGTPLADAASSSTVADFNGDGVDDIYIAVTWETSSAQPRSSLLLLSDGSGGVTDASATLPNDAQYPHWTTSADVDADGDVDIYVCNLGNDFGDYNGTSSYFLINDGTGQFSRSDTRLPTTIETGGRNFTSSLLFDADHDGDPDLLLGTWPSWFFNGTEMAPSTLLFNDGSGNFVETSASILPAPIFAPSRASTLDMMATDMNGDGYLDLFILSADLYASYAVQVLINNGDGAFNDETAERLPSTAGVSNHRFMHLADMNGDGALDLILQTGDATRFFLNDGSGHYVALPADFLFTNSDYAFLPGDFDEDGRTDIFVRASVNSWDDPNNVIETDWIARWMQPAGALLVGDVAANALLGVALSETLQGLDGDDVIFAGAGDDKLEGGEGSDYLNGGAGTDLMYGGDSSDILTGGAGDDRLFGGEGEDTLVGGTGYDRMYGGAGDDTYFVNDADDYAYEVAGEGRDRVVSSIDHQLRAEVEDLTLTGVAAIGKGNASDNLIVGNAVANKLYGYEGNDTIDGAGGDDFLLGADGNDTLTGGAGYDRMYGGIGNDTFVVGDLADYAYENLGEGYDTVFTSINHQLRPNIEQLVLDGFSDLRGYGNALDNMMIGNSGNNLLYGKDGADTIRAGLGNDILYGENGTDYLYGGSGLDRFYGGAGADLFAFENLDFAGMGSGTADRIHDFSHAQGDRISLELVDANSNVGFDQAFTFVGSAAFSNVAGQLRYQQISGNTYVQGDTDGDGKADFWIRVDGLHALAATDFIL
ncbi:VCBS repeat-containing protein [Sphingomonas rhizophila]|uniref:VCBS repeat-containing protein n=1 Tax=Sphingomonas rhizophila TaxID=2071607 RepID=A0A7G9SBP1_9SPHN|nr:FG-GAP-like repeat-containing protein [Sphingomonas rhizophila]QNN65266.1 VCBS repeat-containing protein [Sphingomonas rhizophila]